MDDSQLINVFSVMVQHDQKNEKKIILKDIVNDVHVDDFRDWANLLPIDVRDLIYTLLFEVDQLRFRLTCKAWQCAAIHHPRPQQFPWLIYSSKPQSQGVFKFFSPISNQTNVVKIPKLAGAVFRCSRFGWLLMSRGDHSLFFYHPFITRSTIEISDFIYYNQNVSMYFTAPPTSPDCIVLAYDFCTEEHSFYIYKCAIGEAWTRYQIASKLPFKTSLCTPVFYKNAFYQLDINGRLGVLGPKEISDNQQFTWKDIPQPMVRNDIFSFNSKNYIAECDGELVLVFVDRRMADEIHVFRLDWSKMQWVTVKSLGSKAMFIGETGSLLIETKGVVGGAGNKIYFPRFVNERPYCKGQSYAEEKEIGVFYCLETCKHNALESKNRIGTRGVQNFTWIETNIDLDGWFKYLEDCVSDSDDEDYAV